MSNETFATLRADVSQFKQMLTLSSLSGDVEHDDVYLNVLEDEVRVLQSAPGEVVLTYCSFGQDYFDKIALEKGTQEMEAQGPSGSTYEHEVGAEAILNVEDTLTYLSFAKDSGTVVLELTGSSERRLASSVQADGALDAWTRLPGSSDTLEAVPHWLPFRFNEDDVYCSGEGNPAPVIVETTTRPVQKIIDVVNANRNVDYYPIATDDDRFMISVGDEEDEGVEGELSGTVTNKAGEDVENYYLDGFQEIFGTLSGPVELQTAPGNNPLSAVQSDSTEYTIRHINGSVNEV